MSPLPIIANMPLQPLEVPGGWRVITNHFYQLDPDDDLVGREILHIEPSSITDPWDDVLYYYFDHSYLWRAIRSDNRYMICLEWTMMGARDGQYVINEYRGSPIRFAKEPPRTLSRKHEDIEILYEIDAPIIFSDEPERTFESRDRHQIVLTLNRWLAECS